MSDPYSQDDAKRYRDFQYAVPTPQSDPEGLWEKAHRTRDAYVERLRKRDARVLPFVPLSAAEQRAYITQRYAPTIPQGIGVQQGEFTSIRREDHAPAHQFIGTDYLLDCQALVLVARDARGEVMETSIAHINFRIDAPTEVRRMIARLPEGSRIDATILGGPQHDNPYLQMDLLDTLSQEPRVASIRYGFDDATTLAVDTTTGKILTSAVFETKATMNFAPELPVQLTFTPVRSKDSWFAFAAMAERLFYYNGNEPILPLFEAYTARNGFPGDEPLKSMFEATWQDGRVTEGELREVANEIGKILRTPITVNVTRGGEQDFPLFQFMSKNIVLAQDYINDTNKPDLPAEGTVLAPLPQMAGASNAASSRNQR